MAKSTTYKIQNILFTREDLHYTICRTETDKIDDTYQAMGGSNSILKKSKKTVTTEDHAIDLSKDSIDEKDLGALRLMDKDTSYAVVTNHMRRIFVGEEELTGAEKDLIKNWSRLNEWGYVSNEFNFMTKSGRQQFNPFYMAAFMGRIDVFETLMEVDDPCAVVPGTHPGDTLAIALKKGYFNIADLILNHENFDAATIFLDNDGEYRLNARDCMIDFISDGAPSQKKAKETLGLVKEKTKGLPPLKKVRGGGSLVA